MIPNKQKKPKESERKIQSLVESVVLLVNSMALRIVASDASLKKKAKTKNVCGFHSFLFLVGMEKTMPVGISHKNTSNELQICVEKQMSNKKKLKEWAKAKFALKLHHFLSLSYLRTLCNHEMILFHAAATAAQPPTPCFHVSECLKFMYTYYKVVVEVTCFFSFSSSTVLDFCFLVG